MVGPLAASQAFRTYCQWYVMMLVAMASQMQTNNALGWSDTETPLEGEKELGQNIANIAVIDTVMVSKMAWHNFQFISEAMGTDLCKLHQKMFPNGRMILGGTSMGAAASLYAALEAERNLTSLDLSQFREAQILCWPGSRKNRGVDSSDSTNRLGNT